MITFVCGAQNLSSANTPDGGQYNLGVLFVTPSLLSTEAIQVKLFRHGRVLVDFVALGPRGLFALPDASYRIEATANGETKDKTVNTGSFINEIRW